MLRMVVHLELPMSTLLGRLSSLVGPSPDTEKPDQLVFAGACQAPHI